MGYAKQIRHVHRSSGKTVFRLMGWIFLIFIGVMIGVRPARRSVLIFSGIFSVVVIWYLWIPASNDRD